MSDTGWLERAAGFFVAPAAESTRPRAASIPPAARAAVLGAPDEVVAAAAAVALGLRGRDAAPAALVALWRGEPRSTNVATRAATPPAAGVATRAAGPPSAGVATRAATR
ncbi:MAG TPA: hypothetical protein VFX51_28515, partial [Solirubrobacteraceae bacterium]|nr:hypothetical protein [Solirubrobacteraceae bacterium]